MFSQRLAWSWLSYRMLCCVIWLKQVDVSEVGLRTASINSAILAMKAVSPSETSVYFYESTRCNIPDDSQLQLETFYSHFLTDSSLKIITSNLNFVVEQCHTSKVKFNIFLQSKPWSCSGTTVLLSFPIQILLAFIISLLFATNSDYLSKHILTYNKYGSHIYLFALRTCQGIKGIRTFGNGHSEVQHS
jgi:hypothetical protein